MKNKNLYKSFLVIVVFIVIGFLLVNYFSKDFQIKNTKYIKIAGQSVQVDLAITNEEQMRGLSGRESLNNDRGMLFLFEKPDKYYFWMKGMNFPIDIIWIAEDMSVVYIKKDAQPENFLETYGPDQNAKYVLEVVSGFSDKNNLQIGDKVVFTY